MAQLDIQQIFKDCQRTSATHPKLLKNLVEVYMKSDFDQFFVEFTNLLKKSLVFGDKQPVVDRTLAFVAKFATSRKNGKDEKSSEMDDNEEKIEDEADPFLVKVIQFLLDNHLANSQAVRYRVCQLINILLGQMGEEAVIEDELYNNIYDTMLHRLQDKVPAVRVQAVMAVARLQDPRNKECPVIRAYRYHIAMDPNADVRRAVLTNIAISYQTLPDILERTRDVRDLVRRQAFLVISQRVHLKSLTIAQRVRLISEGLKDRSEMVRMCVEKKLIQAWLRMVHGNVLDLLTCLDVEASVKEAELAIKAIFLDVAYPNLIDNFGIDKDQRLVNYDKLHPESALYWRCLAQHLRNEGAEEALDSILPELTRFCQYLQEYILTEVMDTGDDQEMAVRSMEKEFVTKQLISMTMLYDLSDEVGRRSLDHLIRTLLVSDKVGETLVKGVVEVFGRLHPANARINQLAEIISEVREPVEKVAEKPLSEEEKRKRKLQAAKVKVKINQVKEELEECVRSLDIDRAKVLKEELEALEAEADGINMDTTTSEEVMEERKDSETLSKCLMIVCNMVESADITVMNPTLHSLHENLILQCLRSEDPAVRNKGVHALGLLCLLSKDLAHQHLTLFMQVSRIDVEQIQMTALRSVIDMLHLYGLEEFTDEVENINSAAADSLPATENSKEDGEEEGGAIISALCQILDTESGDAHTLVAEGLCKLLLARRITSSKLLSRLILMWYSPATEDDSLLRHMLGVFFPLYASDGGSNQETISEAFLPTLHTLFSAPIRSPLADIDVYDVANFLVSITSPAIRTEQKKDKVNVHDSLVFSICTDIMGFPESSWTKVLLRCLNHLQLTPTNFSTLRQIDVLAQKILEKMKEKPCLKMAARFHHSIKEMLKNAPEVEGKEVSQVENTAAVTSEADDVFTPGSCTGEKTIDNTTNRKKRMLYNQTVSDLEVFTSEPDSDVEGTPKKRLARCLSLVTDSSEIGSPQVTSTQHDEVTATTDCTPVLDKSLRVHLVRLNSPSVDAEVELTPSRKESGVYEDEDLFESQDKFETPQSLDQPTLKNIHQDSPSKSTQIDALSSTTQKDTLPETHTPTPRSSTAEEDSSTSCSTGRRRSKMESSTGQSSEDESTPVKVPRKSQTNKTLKEKFSKLKTRSSSSSPSDSSQLTPNEEANSVRVMDTSGAANDDNVLTQSARRTRGRTATTQPASVAPLSKKRGRPKKSNGNGRTATTQPTSVAPLSKERGRSKKSNGNDLFEDSSQSSSADESVGSDKQGSSNIKHPQRTRSSSRRVPVNSNQEVFSPPSVNSVSSENSTPVRRSSRRGNSSMSDTDSTSVGSSSQRSSSSQKKTARQNSVKTKKLRK
ncbi:hypothetical protein Pmani_025270 [Petrolisthes manimaculis]|uniref:Nuclear condensin complex subunit 3 C-terminal domain-containing protein n=1 Tax=Petrolisthes manimaculis TaxID=1843537 RepID=A0AAE1P5V4_9EUCA|nr:hypothetical protein Pmani_025270 [Petrolisthes manimaculis]